MMPSRISVILSVSAVVLGVESFRADDTCPVPSPCTCWHGRELYCRLKQLKTVPTFQLSRQYTELDLYANYIEEVPSGAFANLPNLTYLNMQHNELKNIHQDAFQGLSQLVSLSLSKNHLRTLPENLFRPFQMLSDLWLYENELTGFPVESLAGAIKDRKMDILSLKENPELPCVVKEEIIEAGIEILPGKFEFPYPCVAQFCPAPSPCYCDSRNIRCDSNRLTAIPTFHLFDYYTKLHLQNNDIEEVPKNAFGNLTSLTHLFVHSNKVTAIHRDAFERLPHLKVLSLYNNHLQALPGNTFDPLDKLSELRLNGNNLRLFPVKSLAKAVEGREMHKLWLQDNPNLPCYFKDDILSEIQTPTDFKFPSPCTLPSCPYPCRCHETKINCDNKGLTRVPDFHSRDDYHTEIYLFANYIEEVPSNAFRNFTSLTHLYIDKNMVTKVHPDAFVGLSQLEVLSLAQNKLQILPNTIFRPLNKLSNLFLYMNELTSVPGDAFEGLSQLEHIRLDNNHLDTLPDTVFDHLTKLSELRLHANRLREFPVGSLTQALGGRTMREISLNDNPNLRCDLMEDILSEIQVPTIFPFPYQNCRDESSCPATLPCTCDGPLVNCQEKGLKTVPSFHYSETAAALKIYGNSIQILPPRSFENLPNLSILFVHNNDIVYVDSEAFYGLPKLQVLSLTNNFLRTLPDTVFDPFTRLSKLYLHNNQLTSFPVTSLAKASNGTRMELLNLDNNPQLPCDIKQKILAVVEKPRDFKFPMNCLADADSPNFTIKRRMNSLWER